MPVIHHKDIEIHYEPHPLIPHLKVFHQDLYAISYDTDTRIMVFSEGQAKIDLEKFGDDHPNAAYARYRFNENPPRKLHSYDHLTCETRKKKFPYPDILGSYGIIGPNQLLVSWRLMGLFRKFRMAPHITIPAVIKFRDTFIEDNYLVLYFYHHGCDHVVWDKTVFGFVKGLINWNLLSTYNFNSFEEFKEFAKRPPTQTNKLLKLTIKDKYDVFYSTLTPRIFISKLLMSHLKFTGIKGVSFQHGGDYETCVVKD